MLRRKIEERKGEREIEVVVGRREKARGGKRAKGGERAKWKMGKQPKNLDNTIEGIICLYWTHKIRYIWFKLYLLLCNFAKIH